MEERKLAPDHSIDPDNSPELDHTMDGEQRIDEPDERAPRRRMLKGVRVSFDHEFNFVDAVLRNLSETGCFIELSDGYLIPDNIRIHNELDGYKIDCEVVRRQGNRIGVKFVGEKIPTGAVRKPNFSILGYGDLRAHDHQSAAQNAAPQRAAGRKKAPVFGKLGTQR